MCSFFEDLVKFKIKLGSIVFSLFHRLYLRDMPLGLQNRGDQICLLKILEN